MSLSPEVYGRVQVTRSKLAELDPLLEGFCARSRFTFSDLGDTLWPRRRLWAREEIDRCLDLTMDLTLPEFLERGFYPDLPWSLYASASLPLAAAQPMRILKTDIFRGVPHSHLADIV